MLHPAWQYGGQNMRYPLQQLLICLLALGAVGLASPLPTLHRQTLDNKQVWELETELLNNNERNGAVQECTARTLQDLLIQAEMEPNVESLVQVLTTPCKTDTPQAAVKELLLPRATSILVSQDATFAIIITPVRGGRTLEIFRDTARGLSVQRLKR